MEKEKVLEIFKKTEGVLKGHFLLTSGRHSDTYMQCAKLFVHAEESERLCKELALEFKDMDIDMVASPAVGGIIMGYEMSRQLKKPNVFFERVDGNMTLKRGFSIPKGSKVAVFEDVVTTGGSVKEVISAIEEMGSHAVAVGSIVDRSNGMVSFNRVYKALLSMEVKSYDANECPICKEGKIELIKPGSRIFKK